MNFSEPDMLSPRAAGTGRQGLEKDLAQKEVRKFAD